MSGGYAKGLTGTEEGKINILHKVLRMNAVRKILVIKLRAIGDVVLSTAVLPNLRSAFPASQIHFLVESAGQEVLDGNPYIDRIIILPRKEWEDLPRRTAYRENLLFIKRLRSQHYDLVIDLFGNPRSALLTRISGARRRVGFAFRVRKAAYNHKVKPRGDRVHEVEFNLDALRSLKIPIIDKSPYFPVRQSDQSTIQQWLNKEGLRISFLVGIHAWGSWNAKRWGLDKFSELGDRLIEIYQAQIVLVWGPGEREYAEQVRSLMRYPAHIAPETTLKELGSLLSLCQLVVANDSGPMHIAAAVGTPTVGIFGPTNWRLQGPYGSRHRAAYKKDLMCLGCNRLECQERTCMEALEVDEVLQVIDKVFPKPVLKRTKQEIL
jgi:predicted lipopolysaccharide heptosyltransferase III